MIKKLLNPLYLLVLTVVINSCKQKDGTSLHSDSGLMNQVGDIISNKDVDGDFKNCNIGRVPQYYSYNKKPFLYEKLHFEDFIRASYKEPKNSQESGWLRIRFVINCKGNAGRFRLLGIDKKFDEVTFSEEIADQLLKLTKQYKNWRILEYKEMSSDYYFYVVFKINKGKIEEILP